MAIFWTVLVLFLIAIHIYARSKDDFELELALLFVYDPSVIVFGLAITFTWNGWVHPWWAFLVSTLMTAFLIREFFRREAWPWMAIAYISFSGTVTFAGCAVAHATTAVVRMFH